MNQVKQIKLVTDPVKQGRQQIPGRHSAAIESKLEKLRKAIASKPRDLSSDQTIPESGIDRSGLDPFFDTTSIRLSDLSKQEVNKLVPHPELPGCLVLRTETQVSREPTLLQLGLINAAANLQGSDFDVVERSTYGKDTAQHLLATVPQNQKRAAIVDIINPAQALLRAVRSLFGQISTSADFFSHDSAHAVIWAMIEDYVVNRSAWHEEYSPGGEYLLSVTPRARQRLESYIPPRYFLTPEGYLDLGGLHDKFYCEVLPMIQEAVYNQVNGIIGIDATWDVWGVMAVDQQTPSGRVIGRTLMLVGGPDYRILDWNRRMESGEWQF